MQYQVAILTHVARKGDIPTTKLMKIIRPTATLEEARSVADALKPHIFQQDVLLVYEAYGEEKNVVYRYDPSAGGML